MMTGNERVQQDNNSQDNSQDETIQRCPHDEENPYTMILNELIRDISISPNCRWLIMYLLSNKAGWKISIKQVVNHVKGFIGRNNVYALFDEAIEAGYIKKEVRKTGNLYQGYQYYVSERPKFKNILRHPEFGEAELPNPEIGDYKKERSKEEIYKENDIVPETSSFSYIENKTVSFDPRTYRLKDGKLLTARTVGSFVNYMKTPEGAAKLARNLSFYEAEIERGYRPNDHEKYLQYCLNKDLAHKAENCHQNDLYARVMIAEYKLTGVVILKTVVQFRKAGETVPISIDKNLPHGTFANIFENYIKSIQT